MFEYSRRTAIAFAVLAGAFLLTLGSFGSGPLPAAPSDLGWRYRRADLAGSAFYPQGSTVATQSTLRPMWSAAGTPGLYPPLTGDVNGDGYLEVVQVQLDQLRIWSHTGAILQTVTLPNPDCYLTMLQDYNGDGIVDIGVGTWTGAAVPRAWFYDGDANLLAEFEIIGEAFSDTGMAPVAILPDGNVVMEEGSGLDLSSRGVSLWEASTGIRIWDYRTGGTWHVDSVADADGNGDLDFALESFSAGNGGWGCGATGYATCTDDYNLYTAVVRQDGMEFFTATLSGVGGILKSYIVDLNHDGIKEILSMEGHNSTTFPGTATLRLYDIIQPNIASRRTGKPNAVLTFAGPPNVEWAAAVADLDGDGPDEVVATVGNPVGGKIYILNDMLQQIRSAYVSGTVQFVCDINGDGAKEIVLLDGAGTIRVLDASLNSLGAYPTATAWGGVGMASCADIDLDGIVEIIAVTDAIHVLKPRLCAVTCAASATPSGGAAPLLVSFAASATPTYCVGTPTYLWAFGDGPTSTLQNPTHTYAYPATYTWTLSVTVDGKTCSQMGNVVVTAPCSVTCTASATPSSGQAPLDVNFTASATASNCAGTPTFDWDFGDGSPHSTQQNPAHRYGIAGTYAWTLTATVDGRTCVQTGTILATAQPTCSLTCTASASPGAGAAPLSVAFTGSATLSNCVGTPSFQWDFGDGGTASAQNPSHTYLTGGTFNWTLQVTVDGQTCSQGGAVTVSSVTGTLQGTTAIRSGTSNYALDGSGIVSAAAILKDVNQSVVATVPVVLGAFQFDGVAAGSYTVQVQVQYTDHIAFDASSGPYGCENPPAGILVKEVTSAPVPVAVTPGTTTVSVVFPPPVVFLHGAIQCYARWLSNVPADPDFASYWDNAARAAGFFSFTPNNVTFGAGFSWPAAASQVTAQVQPDLLGLHTPQFRAAANDHVPWTLVGHDMGGLVARVLATQLGTGQPYFNALLKIYLLGTPNSGADMLLGGESPSLSQNSVVRRFNEVYRDFGPSDNKVASIAGDADWWGGSSGDGPLFLQSALSITRLTCAQGSTTQCTPYGHKAYKGNDGPVVTYPHFDLGAPPSKDEVLMNLILGIGRRSEKAVPESPAGSILWGTGARTTGTTEGTASGRTASADVPFVIGATDGMAIGAWVYSGAATFQVLDPGGQVAGTSNPDGSSPGSPGFLFTRLNPQAGTWILRVLPAPGGASYTATAVENSPFSILGYLDRTAYFAGQTAGFGLETVGDYGGVTIQDVTATLFGLSGSPIQTIPLTLHGQRYTGSLPVPTTAGSYPVTFSLTGTYQGQSFIRLAFERLNVLASSRASRSTIFTGTFSDSPEDRDANGKFDTLVFQAQAALPTAGVYAFSADLYDASDNWIAWGSTSQSVGTPGTVMASIAFPLAGITSAQFSAPLQIRHLSATDGASLIPVDLWPTPVDTQTYDASSFDCVPGIPPPSLSAVRPDEGLPGRSYALVLSGTNLRFGTTVSLGPGITVNGAILFAEGVMIVSISVLPDAVPGFRDIVVTNPDGMSATLVEGFQINAVSSPHATLTYPDDGDTVHGRVLLTASAAGDLPIDRVDFLVDGAVIGSAARFPFRFLWNTTQGTAGPHTLAARAVDEGGQTSTSAPVDVQVEIACCDADVNCDGVVNILDMIKVQRCILGLDTGAACDRSDVNHDGVVNIMDMIKVQRAILGLDPCA